MRRRNKIEGEGEEIALEQVGVEQVWFEQVWFEQIGLHKIGRWFVPPASAEVLLNNQELT